MQSQGHRGFTLIELIIALLIVAILATLAYPGYTQQQLRGNRSEGYAALNEIMQAQERFAVDHGRYTTDLSALGYSNPHTTTSGRYAVSAQHCKKGASDYCVLLVASALGSQVGDSNGENGNLSLNSRGEKAGW